MNIFTIIIGFFAGLAFGFFAGWLFVEYHWMDNNTVYKSLLGALVGGGGALAGSISGRRNRSSDSSGGNKVLWDAIFGILGGVLGGTKFDILRQMMLSMGMNSVI